MIHVGLDDTDTLDSPGTNQLAKAIARHLAGRFWTRRIVRHQLFFDPRVPYTSKNGSASLVLESEGITDLEYLFEEIRGVMRTHFVPGSDPGLCVAAEVPAALTAYARRCQVGLMTQAEARQLAATCQVRLEGLGGTEDGVIGALAAVGLSPTGDDGRIIQWNEEPDDLTGPLPLEILTRRGVTVVEDVTGNLVLEGIVDVGKHLRPNLRGGRPVLFVSPMPQEGNALGWIALKKT